MSSFPFHRKPLRYWRVKIFFYFITFLLHLRNIYSIFSQLFQYWNIDETVAEIAAEHNQLNGTLTTVNYD